MKKIKLFLLSIFSLLQTVYAVPVITSFSPTSGPIGAAVLITGTGFSANPTNNTVFFGATKAAVSAASSTQLTVTVPAGASYEYITVMVSNLIAYSAKPFIVTFCSSNTISFAAKIDFTLGSNCSSVAICDLDLDGKPDLLGASGAFLFSAFRNTSSIWNISFAPKVDFTTGNSPNDISTGDIDLDGKPDVVVVNSFANSISVFRNTSAVGTISFASKVDFTTGLSGLYKVAIGDIDLDGKPEIVVTNQNSSSVSVFRNTSSIGTISLASNVDFATGSVPRSVEIGDIDGNGKPDLVVANYNSNSVSVFRNTSIIGTISFAGKVDFATATNPQKAAIGDFDLDGKPDISVVSAFPSNLVSVLRNTSSSGTISFAVKVDFAANDAFSISICDIDGNGKPDLSVANLSSAFAVSVFRNTSSAGSISFDSKVDFATGNTNFATYDIATGDIDLDGKPDLASVNFNSGILSVLRNIIPGAPTIFETPVDIGCFGGADGSINLTLIGGTTPFSYLWSNGAITEDLSNLGGGTYTVTVTAANGCTSTTTVILTQPSVIANSFVITNISCNGAATGAIDLTPSGGSGPYTYLWSNGAITQDLVNLIAGTYIVTVTDANGCTKVDGVILTTPNSVVINVPSITNCNGQSGTLTATGATTYTWSPSTGLSSTTGTSVLANPVATSTYTIIGTNASGCTGTTSVVVSVNTSPIINVVPTTICNGQSGTLTAVGAVIYTWSPSTSLSASTGTSVIASPSFTTTYTVTGTNANGCTGSTTVIVTVIPNQTISETHVNANCGQTNGSIDITVNGSTYLWSNGATTQDINNLVAGTYTVTVTNSTGCTQSLSITITQLPSTCETPTNISVINITGTKATVSWTGNSCAVKYRVRYRVQGTTTWVTKIVTAPITTKTLTLLQPLTTYEYQVRTDCNSAGTVFSAYSTIQTFTTICDCTKPTNLAVSNVTQTGATVSWIGNACALKYRLQYRKQGTTTWTTKTINSPTLFYNIIGLTNNSIYEYHLRSDCNATGSINSGFTTTSTITTIPRLEDTEIGSSTFYVLPNPCSRCFVSGAENESDLIVTDIVGRIVSVEYTKSENGFYINMPDASIGFYLIRNNRTGEVVKFVKE